MTDREIVKSIDNENKKRERNVRRRLETVAKKLSFLKGKKVNLGGKELSTVIDVISTKCDREVGYFPPGITIITRYGNNDYYDYYSFDANRKFNRIGLATMVNYEVDFDTENFTSTDFDKKDKHLFTIEEIISFFK